jgi:DNA gyrase subunit B
MSILFDRPGKDASLATYNEQSIVVLSGIDAIRKRPSMYVGSTGPEGLHHLAFELIENAVDEFLAGCCSQIRVELHEDGSCSVTDDGRGIPVARHQSSNRSAVETLMTQLHSSGKFDKSVYRLPGGLHGLGLTCVNALSERLQVEVWRDGEVHIQDFRCGQPVGDLRVVGRTTRQGTTIRFWPDRSIFTDQPGFSHDRIASRLRDLAFLNEGLSLTILDRPNAREDTYFFSTGLGGLVVELNRGRVPRHAEPLCCTLRAAGLTLRVGLQWTTSHADEIYSFVNSVRTTEAGSHVDGLKRAIVASITSYARSTGMVAIDAGEITAADALEGLAAVIAVDLEAAQFDNQVKSRLVKPGLDYAVDRLLSEALLGLFAASPDTAVAIVSRVLEAQRTRLAAQRASLPTQFFSPEAAQSLNVYRKQFGIRSENWHDSCRWLTDEGLLNAHAEMCVAGKDARMLDVCCGSGIVGAAFGDRVVHKTGLDITPEMRALASTRLNEVREGSVYEIPFEADTFDIAVTREVLHLLPEPHRPLREVLRVLKPGGQLIFGQTVPYGAVDAAWVFRIFKKKQPLFCNNFLAEDLVGLLEAAGFDRVETREYFLWEPIDRWIDSHETSALHRQEIRDLYHHAPRDVRQVHPFEIAEDGKISDRWRWWIYSARKPG